MHNKTRVLLCRVAFIALCVLPTTIIAGWIVTRGVGGHSAAEKAEWQRELSQRLGVVVELADVTYPSPNIARLVDLRLLAIETRQPIGEAARVEITKSPGGWVIDVDELLLEVNQLPWLARTIDERLLRDSHLPALRWYARNVILRDNERGQTLAQFGGQLRASPAASELDCKFRLAGDAVEPLSLHTRRSRDQGPPATVWRLNTAGQSLPCWLAAIPALGRFGADCEFSGTVHIIQHADNSSGELTGTLTRVDLDALVTEQLPHVLSGVATVTLERAVIDCGKLKELRGRLDASGGAISQSLIAAAQEHLQLEPSDPVNALDAAEEIRYDRLALSFELSGPWLTLLGHADANYHGAMLTSAGKPLFSAPSGHAITSACLLRTLLPDSRHQVPATQRTSALIRLLPLPDVAPAAHGKHRHTPTRLAPASPRAEARVRQPVLR